MAYKETSDEKSLSVPSPLYSYIKPESTLRILSLRNSVLTNQDATAASSEENYKQIRDQAGMEATRLGHQDLKKPEEKPNLSSRKYLHIRVKATDTFSPPTAPRAHSIQSERNLIHAAVSSHEPISTTSKFYSAELKKNIREIPSKSTLVPSSKDMARLVTSSTANTGLSQVHCVTSTYTTTTLCSEAGKSTPLIQKNENWRQKFHRLTDQTQNYLTSGYSSAAETFSKSFAPLRRSKDDIGELHRRSMSKSCGNDMNQPIISGINMTSALTQVPISDSNLKPDRSPNPVPVVRMNCRGFGSAISVISCWRHKNAKNNTNDNRKMDGARGDNVNQNKESPKAAGSDASDSDDDDDVSDDDRLKSYVETNTMTGVEWLDGFLVVWHTAFLIISLFLLSVGVILRFYFTTIVESEVRGSTNFIVYSHFVNMQNMPSVLRFGSLTDVLGDALIIINGIYILCVIVYMTYLLHRIPFTLPIVVIICGALVLTEVNILNIYMSPVSAANERAKKELKATAETEYSIGATSDFAVTYDVISVWGQCCGVVDQYDFQNVVLKYSLTTKSEYKTLQVPPTCCKPEYFHKGVDAVVECASKAEGIFPEGCYVKIYKWLKHYCNLFSIVIVLQLIDICIHILIYKRHLALLEISIV